MSNKGSIDVGCGSFSYEIVAPPEPPKPDTPVTCNPSDVPLGGWTAKSGYPAPAYKAGSHQYCYGNGQRYDWTATAGDSNSAANYFWFDTTTTDPSTNLPTYCLGSAKGEYNQWSPPSQKNCKATGEQRADSQIGLRVIPVKDQSGCQPLRDHKLPVDGDCTKIFDQVTDQCITGNPNDSAGFYLENGPDGCWEWWIYGMTRG
jgi:hypothetical protein